eukprot:CAMPEP_0168530252 /NCGR_PEP_ID=MMETSP0405-20121227/14534_1 /TAXON_ID=498012 /ORGANISM="Trichosphaerium sp, Strain Am-I-7 wt" /LENGTH=88 /DNA_ID=CAMNT_0008554413 /DNA_START=15 /DNA_END=281 /DNA_ORIENTATION=+
MDISPGNVAVQVVPTRNMKDVLNVDFEKLDITALKLYKKKNRLTKVRTNASKKDLVEAATAHFLNWKTPPDSVVIENFIYNCKFMQGQ